MTTMKPNKFNCKSGPSRPLVLTIAASDSAGLAGIAVDIKTQNAFDVHSLTVITANTAQNNSTVISINPVDDKVFEDQLQAIKHFKFSLVKVGLVANLSQAKIIANFVQDNQLTMVLDPVFSATSRSIFLHPSKLSDYLKIMLPISTLLTPNQKEASQLTGLSVGNPSEVELAASKLVQLGAKHVLIKGGTDDSETSNLIASSRNKTCNDFYRSQSQQFWLFQETIETVNTRGTGCAFSSSATAAMAIGYSVEDAVVIAKMAVNQGLRNSYPISNEKGTNKIKEFPKSLSDLPLLAQRQPKAVTKSSCLQGSFPKIKFASLNSAILEKTKRSHSKSYSPPPLGLYPVVDSADWIERLSETGITTIQLRIKQAPSDYIEEQVKLAVSIAQKSRIRLFINDYWQLAIKYNAYGVHLGQEDLSTANLLAIHSAGLRLGISTHCHYEVARALFFNPSYIACGPIYPTTSKQMPWRPHGLTGLNYWLDILDCPVVAIGGINQSRFKKIAQTNVNGIAMISAITLAKNPEQVCSDFMQQFEQCQTIG